jgi:hypothetical protein
VLQVLHLLQKNMKTSENKLQSNCFLWSWNKLPETRMLISYNLGNSKNKVDGARNKSLGLIKGRADMEMLWKGKLYYFEFKTLIGKQSQDQKDFKLKVESHGAEYYIIRTESDFRERVQSITQR